MSSTVSARTNRGQLQQSAHHRHTGTCVHCDLCRDQQQEGDVPNTLPTISTQTRARGLRCPSSRLTPGAARLPRYVPHASCWCAAYACLRTAVWVHGVTSGGVPSVKNMRNARRFLRTTTSRSHSPKTDVTPHPAVLRTGAALRQGGSR